jgi:predicted PurR-regulated permease PerM
MQVGNEGALNIAAKFFEEKITVLAPEISINIGEYLQRISSWIIEHLDNFFSSFFKVLIGLLLMIISLFYFLRDGERMVKRLISLSPLADSYDEQIMKKVGSAINSIVRGSLAIALIKGFLTALGFAIFSIPNPILWGTVTAFASFIPIVGSSIVVAPAVLYLFATSSLASSIGFAVWGIAFVGLSDNVLSPILMERGMKIHPFLLLLSIFGGLGLFGPIGFIAGPVVLSLLFALFDIYPLITKKIIYEKNNN